jgi:hypothetical protein
MITVSSCLRAAEASEKEKPKLLQFSCSWGLYVGVDKLNCERERGWVSASITLLVPAAWVMEWEGEW